MIEKQYSKRKFEQVLKKNGFVYVRSKGSHSIYYKGSIHISIPITSTPNKMLIKRLIKEYNLVV